MNLKYILTLLILFFLIFNFVIIYFDNQKPKQISQHYQIVKGAAIQEIKTGVITPLSNETEIIKVK